MAFFQIYVESHQFRYDQVYGGLGSDPSALFSDCVSPLVAGLFQGYNATVLAYGQTGSGKTFTMGSAFGTEARPEGVIPRAIAAIFSRVRAAAPGVEFSLRVGFVEIHREEIRDLLASSSPAQPVQIREAVGGGVVLSGATEREVRSAEEMALVLEQGAAVRATGATGMNRVSSRSHAVFTITVEQRRSEEGAGSGAAGVAPRSSRSELREDEDEDDEEAEEAAPAPLFHDEDSYLCAKLHLVDLAGSERAKRTRASGARLAEGITINRGLLALGNVIAALTDAKGRQHVPYRDSKLTRMLQDSLGGNSRTLVVACASPADVNLEETLSTLRYASRARNVRNRPVVNRDPAAAEVARLRRELAEARAFAALLQRRLREAGLADGRGEGGGGEPLASARAAVLPRAGLLPPPTLDPEDDAVVAAMADLELRARRLALENRSLEGALSELKRTVGAVAGDLGEEDASRAVLEAGLQRVSACRALEELEEGDELEELDALVSARGLGEEEGADEGEEEGLGSGRSGRSGEDGDAEAEERRSRNADGPSSTPAQPLSLSSSRPPSPSQRLQRLEARLEARLRRKQAALDAVEDGAALKAAHARAERDLELARQELAAEREAQKGRAAAAAALDARERGVRVKERRLAELAAARSRAEELAARLARDVARLKAARADLQREQARAARSAAQQSRARARELEAANKRGTAAAAAVRRLQELAARQAAVLRRKTAEAEAARRRLKQVAEGRAASAGRRAGSQPGTARGGGGSREQGKEQAASPRGEARDAGEARRMVRRELEAGAGAAGAGADLRRVLEGAAAERSATARRLRVAEKRLAALRCPGWWGGGGGEGDSSPGGLRGGGAGRGALDERALLEQRRGLQALLERQSAAVRSAAAALARAREEGAEGGGGGRAPSARWAAAQSLEGARLLLAAALEAAEEARETARDAGLGLEEAREEVELLRLKLEIAEQERLETLAARQDREDEIAPPAPHRPQTASPGAHAPGSFAIAGDSSADTTPGPSPEKELRGVRRFFAEMGLGGRAWRRRREDGGSEQSSARGEAEREAEACWHDDRGADGVVVVRAGLDPVADAQRRQGEGEALEKGEASGEALERGSPRRASSGENSARRRVWL